MKSIRDHLPTTFRITGSDIEQASFLRDFMEKKYFEKMDEIKAVSLPWYPNRLAWSLDVDRSTMKKNPVFATFHKFLVDETQVGNVSRQEAVSMIPSLLLDVQPDHFVLDMCAAPGSKTTQIIEALHRDQEKPSGVVVANDADSKRAYTLVHQAKRLCSPCLLVTNHDGTLVRGIS